MYEKEDGNSKLVVRIYKNGRYEKIKNDYLNWETGKKISYRNLQQKDVKKIKIICYQNL